MRATEFIRGLLDLIDSVDQQENQVTDYEDETSPEPSQGTQYSNSPDELVADVGKVTTDAGGGVNGPKNPADIRVSTIALYPGYTHDPRK
jgi:hypothetical protein